MSPGSELVETSPDHRVIACEWTAGLARFLVYLAGAAGSANSASRPARQGRGCGPYLATASQANGSEEWSYGDTAAMLPACSLVVTLMRLAKCRPGWL
jgi:hypothetical protein